VRATRDPTTTPSPSRTGAARYFADHAKDLIKTAGEHSAEADPLPDLRTRVEEVLQDPDHGRLDRLRRKPRDVRILPEHRPHQDGAFRRDAGRFWTRKDPVPTKMLDA
jgi:hypothetical protein